MNKRYSYIAGVDEVGRGPLAGAVIASAVILDDDKLISGLGDSKKLSEKKRNFLSLEIKEKAISWAIGRAEVFEIDKINILQASLLAMQRAINSLHIKPELILVDGNITPNIDIASKAIINGDAIEASISAASILAKVARDKEMVDLEDKYPGYGFAKHKGYPTKEHLLSLAKLGPSPIHRLSFAPVRKLIVSA